MVERGVNEGEREGGFSLLTQHNVVRMPDHAVDRLLIT